MQLTEEGSKYLDKLLNRLEKVDEEYRNKLTEEQKKILPFFKQEDYYDQLFLEIASWIDEEDEVSEKEIIRQFKEILEDYYKKN